MTQTYHCCYIARVTLQTQSPLFIATGLYDKLLTNELMRDANGLPTIAGTSLAGVLRHLYQDHREHLPTQDKQRLHTPEQVFGHMDDTEKQGKASKLTVSFAHVHDQHNQAIDGLYTNLQHDPILQYLANEHALIRDGVAINHQGVAKDQHKFEQALIPKGTRFSFEMLYWCDDQQETAHSNQQTWQCLLHLLSDPRFRLGGRTRSGLGCVEVIACHTRYLNLNDTSDYQIFSQLSRNIFTIEPLKPYKVNPNNTETQRFSQLSLQLQAEDFWRPGGGHNPFCLQKEKGREADALIYSEHEILWSTQQGQDTAILSKQPTPILPASSIKGALAHRVAFHYNCLQGHFADQEDINLQEHVGSCNLAVKTLFGYTSQLDQHNSHQNAGAAGLIWLRDCTVKAFDTATHTGIQTHNCIDRFTGGVRQGALFSEELLYQTPALYFELILDTRQTKSIEPNIWTALEKTLADLCEGRLSFGAGSGKGHGYFWGVSDTLEPFFTPLRQAHNKEPIHAQ